MAKRITFDREAREALMVGVSKFARAVKSTLGPRGRYAIVDRGFGSPRVTKDGATVAQDVELRHPVQNLAVRLMQEAAKKTADQAGDGSTTSTVLAEAIFLRGMRNIAAGANPILLQRGVSVAAQEAVEALKKQAVEVSGLERIAAIAATAANNSPEVGKIIAEALDRVGHDGIVSIEEGKSIETTLEVVEGMQFDRGYLSQYFVTNDATAKVILKEPLILIMEEKISNLSQILPLLEKVAQKRKPLLIIAEDIDGEALATLVVNRQRGVLTCAAVKAPGYGDRRKAILRDIAVCTSGTAIFKELGLTPTAIGLGHLGTAARVEITSETTIIVKGAGSKKDIEDQARQIRLELEQSESDYDKEKLRERLAHLVGGVAEIRIGGATETEVKEKKKLYENALSATRSALEEGIVPGGGIAFLHCIPTVAGKKAKSDVPSDEEVGREVLRAALEAPFRQLARNAGEEPSQILRRLRAQKSGTYGFDFEKKADCDMVEAGIVDSVRVARLALQNAASVAGILFTSDCVVTTIPKEKDDEHDHEHPELQDYDF